MSRHILCIGSLSNRRQVVVGWDPAGQQFRVEVTRPDDVWLDHLDDGDIPDGPLRNLHSASRVELNPITFWRPSNFRRRPHRP